MANRASLLLCLVVVLVSVNLVECNRRLLNRMLQELRKMNSTLCDKIEDADDDIRALAKKYDYSTCPVPCQPVCQPEEMCINLNDVVAPIGSIPGVSVYSPLTSLINGKPCSRQVVLKVHFQRGFGLNTCVPNNRLPQLKTSLPQQRFLKIQMYLSNGERSGFLFNIGDSKSNNGNGGDGSDQSFDAELQGLAQTTSKSIQVYRNDNCGGPPLWDSHVNAINYPVSLVNVWIRNSYLKVSNDNGHLRSNCSNCLFALNGQNDVEGPENEDIYVAGNRVIAGGVRTGVGLCYMKLRWVNSPFQ